MSESWTGVHERCPEESSDVYSSHVLFQIRPVVANAPITKRQDARQALKPCFEFVSKELHILQDILVRPLARGKVLHEWEELGDQHRWKIGGGRFRDEVLKHPKGMNEVEILKAKRKAHAKRRYINPHDLFLGSGLRNADEKRNDIVSPVQLLSNAINGGVGGGFTC